MKSLNELLKEIEELGYSDADIASHIGRTTRTVENWRSGRAKASVDILAQLQAMAKKSPKHQSVIVENDNPDLMLLRIQNLALNIEAKEDANTEMLKLIYQAISNKSPDEVKSIYEKLLSGSQSAGLKGSNIVRRNTE